MTPICVGIVLWLLGEVAVIGCACWAVSVARPLIDREDGDEPGYRRSE